MLFKVFSNPENINHIIFFNPSMDKPIRQQKPAIMV
jgi:hypothetical protein